MSAFTKEVSDKLLCQDTELKGWSCLGPSQDPVSAPLDGWGGSQSESGSVSGSVVMQELPN